MSTNKAAAANRYNFLIVFLVTFGSLTYGYNSAIIGAVLGLTSFFKYFGIDLYGSNAAEGSRITGATNGVFAAGGLLGCILMTWLGDAFGRKVAIQVTSVLCIIAGIIQAASMHIAMFLVGRFLMGLGVGMVNVITPLYQSEISPAHLRGRMVGTHGFILCVGYVSDLGIAEVFPQLTIQGSGRLDGIWVFRQTHNGACVSHSRSSLHFACSSDRCGCLSLRGISWPWTDTTKAFEYYRTCIVYLVNRMIFWPGRSSTRSGNNSTSRKERGGGRVGSRDGC